MAPVTQSNLVSCRRIVFQNDPENDQEVNPAKIPHTQNFSQNQNSGVNLPRDHTPKGGLTKNSTNYLLKIPDGISQNNFTRNASS
jgi:hypothetical protein